MSLVASNIVQPESTVDQVAETVDADNVPKFAGGDVSVNEQSATAPTQSQQSGLDPTRMDAGAFPGMSWNGPGNPNAMNPFMANAMFNFTNPMGKSSQSELRTLSSFTNVSHSRHAYDDGPNGRKSGDVR